MPRINLFCSSCLAFLLLGSLFLGCGSNNSAEDAVARVNSTNIQRLVNLYFAYQMKHNWKGPSDEDEFKEFIRNFPINKLNRINLDPANIDQVFVNERDGEPFKIRYSVLGGRGCTKPVVYETVGINSKRMVGFLNMEQREVEQDEYDKLWKGE